jgi:hypothetical protein
MPSFYKVMALLLYNFWKRHRGKYFICVKLALANRWWKTTLNQFVGDYWSSFNRNRMDLSPELLYTICTVQSENWFNLPL